MYNVITINKELVTKEVRIMEKKMIDYLQGMLDEFMVEKNKFGISDRIVGKKLDKMLACKEMAETMIGMPINLGIDGKVTIGF